MRAKFIGEEGLSGFKKGKVYQITTWVGSQFLRTDGYIWVKDVNSGLTCPYSRIETFLRNWEIVKEEQE